MYDRVYSDYDNLNAIQNYFSIQLMNSLSLWIVLAI